MPVGPDKAKARSVVALAQSGQAEFVNCAMTLTGAKETDSGDQGQVIQSLATVFATEEMSQDGQTPQVRLSKCFVRGRGDVLLVRGSQAFNLDLDNCLAALDGSLVLVVGQPKEPPLDRQAQINCKRVFAYLNEAFLELRANSADRKVMGLAPTQVKCDDCLFVAAADKAFVHAIGVGNEALKQLLVWQDSKGNLYGNYQKMLHIELPEQMMNMTMPADLTAKGWVGTFTHEPEDSFPRVTLSQPLPAERLNTCQPADFLRAKISDTKRMDVSTGDFDAVLNQLPKADDE
jgi:hypothetical protein